MPLAIRNCGQDPLTVDGNGSGLCRRRCGVFPGPLHDFPIDHSAQRYPEPSNPLFAGCCGRSDSCAYRNRCRRCCRAADRGLGAIAGLRKDQPDDGAVIRDPQSGQCAVGYPFHDRRQYGLFSRPATPFTLGPNAIGDVTVTFLPKVAGAASATLRIASDDPLGRIMTIPLTGAGQ